LSTFAGTWGIICLVRCGYIIVQNLVVVVCFIGEFEPSFNHCPRCEGFDNCSVLMYSCIWELYSCGLNLLSRVTNFTFPISVVPVQCNEGHYSPAGSATCASCPAGYQCANASTSPEICPQGYQSMAMSASCTACPAGIACPASYDPTMNHPCVEGMCQIVVTIHLLYAFLNLLSKIYIYRRIS